MSADDQGTPPQVTPQLLVPRPVARQAGSFPAGSIRHRSSGAVVVPTIRCAILVSCRTCALASGRRPAACPPERGPALQVVTFLHHPEQVYGTKLSAETISRPSIKYWSRWRFLDDESDAKPQAPTACTARKPSTYSLGNACRFRLMQSVGSDYRRSENVRCLSASRSSGAAWRRCHFICHWLKDLCSNWGPAGPNPIDDETYGLRADGRANATATTASQRPVRSQRVQPGRRRCPPVYGQPGELRLKSTRERMDIISAHREVGIYRGAAVACGTESRCQSWSFLPLGAEARLS